MAILEFLPLIAFAGIKLPASKLSVRGGQRKHSHEFPHSPGAEQEKLGRKAYVMRATCHFHNLPGTDFAEKYPDCYPGSLQRIRRLGEQGTTADFIIPSIGAIKAFLTEWDQLADFERSLSGEEVTLELEEDQDSAFLTNAVFKIAASGLDTRVSKLTAAAALANYFDGPKPSIFDDINDAIGKVQGVLGLGDAYMQLAAAKLEQIANLCSEADRDVLALEHPENHVLLEALKDVWEATVDLAKDVARSGVKIDVYTVPKLMAVGDVATNIYGSATRALELMDLNPIDDVFAIPAGTGIRFRNDRPI